MPVVLPPGEPAVPSAEVRQPRREKLPLSTTIGTRSGLATSLCLLAADFVALAASGAMGFAATYFVIGEAAAISAWRVLLLLSVWQLAGLRVAGLHRSWGIGPVATLARIAGLAATTTTILVAVVVALEQPWSVSAALLIAGCGSALLVSTGRSLVRSLFGRSDWWGRRAFVIGSDTQAVALFTKLLHQPQRGLRPVGFVDDLETLDTDLDPALYLGPPEALRELALEYRVNAAVVAKTDPDAQTQRLFCREELGIRDWILMSSLEGYPSLWGEAVEVGGVPALWARNRLLSPWSRALKRAADLVITITSVLLSLPLLAAIVALVRLGSPGPVFYGQERIGRHGRRFTAWKFRTMVVNADEVLEKYLASDPLLRAEWEANHKLKDDPRITWIGKFLRKTSLDELPQLWNVFLGEMSLVGPRPIVEAEIDKYDEEYEYYVDVLPGITGLWQVSGRNNTTYPERVAFDAYYVKNWSLWLDLYILISTVRVIVFREGAY
jgi:Undecaprenyl-phosphate galactose phosphotransferase WbaP